MKKVKINTRNGFTLLEILLALTIVGVIAAFTIGISYSIRNMTKVNSTKSRMEQIAAKAKQYYRGHGSLPTAGGTTADRVPVGASDLNMEQKFRLDAWGQYFHYNRVEDSATIDNISFTETDIDGLTVDGKSVAGVIISSGPNQTFDVSVTGPGYTTAGDDIVISIDVSQEAVEMALDDLKVLQAKVKAFDAIYEGVDNDGDDLVDCDDGNNDGLCDAAEVTGCAAQFPGCPPTGMTNDPNCGTATLDDIKNDTGTYSGCAFEPFSSTDWARHFICYHYSLADAYRIDPWLNGYVWGDSTTTGGAGDPRYHKFFSAGPDGSAGAAGTPGDDIIP